MRPEVLQHYALWVCPIWSGKNQKVMKRRNTKMKQCVSVRIVARVGKPETKSKEMTAIANNHFSQRYNTKCNTDKENP